MKTQKVILLCANLEQIKEFFQMWSADIYYANPGTGTRMCLERTIKPMEEMVDDWWGTLAGSVLGAGGAERSETQSLLSRSSLSSGEAHK